MISWWVVLLVPPLEVAQVSVPPLEGILGGFVLEDRCNLT